MYLVLPKIPGKIWRKWLVPFAAAILTSLSFNMANRPTPPDSNSIRSKLTVPLSEANSGNFSVITYNIAGLPEPLSSAITARASSIEDIGTRLTSFDIAHVQEDFNYNERLYMGDTMHPYRSKTKGAVPFGDGLNTLSNYPISDIRRIPWRDCTGADCLTPKGFSYSRIQVAQDVYIDFYNVHANAQDYDAAAAARRNNLRQLSAYIKKHSKQQAIIVMGDFNAHYSYPEDNMQEFLLANQLNDSWVLLKQNGKTPAPKTPYPKDDNIHLTDTCESIDKILYRSSDAIRLMPKNYRVEGNRFSTAKGLPLSDHCPVSLTFNWELREH